MTKDELIAEQALKIAKLERQVEQLELTEERYMDKWEAVTKALGLSEFSSLQTVTDRIGTWASKMLEPKCDACGGTHYKAGESLRWCPNRTHTNER